MRTRGLIHAIGILGGAVLLLILFLLKQELRPTSPASTVAGNQAAASSGTVIDGISYELDPAEIIVRVPADQSDYSPEVVFTLLRRQPANTTATTLLRCSNDPSRTIKVAAVTSNTAIVAAAPFSVRCNPVNGGALDKAVEVTMPIVIWHDGRPRQSITLFLRVILVPAISVPPTRATTVVRTNDV